jgi:hypothetical protein
VTLETFGTRSAAEADMQFALHAGAKDSFQKEGLAMVLQLTFQPLNALFHAASVAAAAEAGNGSSDASPSTSTSASASASASASTLGPHLPLLKELFALLSELLSWNFATDSQVSDYIVSEYSLYVFVCMYVCMYVYV